MNKSNTYHLPELKSRSVNPSPISVTNQRHSVAGMKPSISLITPVFNEPEIHNNLPIIDRELSNTGLPYEIIAVNDGSDAITTTLLNNVSLPSLRVYTYAKNQGKGFALKYGFEISSGSFICFMDADLQLHPQQIALFSNLMSLLDADVVIGSKRHALSRVEYGPHRRLYSWTYQQLIRLLFKLNITDTQVGLKLFRRHVLEKVMPRLVVKQWAFDLELLIVAKHLGFNRILEAPVHLTWKPGESHINWKTIPKMLQDTLAIFYRQQILRSYNHSPSTSNLQKITALSNEKIRESDELKQPSLIDTLIEEPPLPKPQPLSSGVIFTAE